MFFNSIKRLIFICLLIISNTALVTWQDIDDRIAQGVVDHAYPGAVILVATPDEILHSKAVGNYYYDDFNEEETVFYRKIQKKFKNSPMQLDTLFDLASVSKVTGTLSGIISFYQRGELDIEEYVASDHLLGNLFGNNGKQDIKVKHLLLHNSGFPPDPNPQYWSEKFNCPERDYIKKGVINAPKDARFTCAGRILASLLQQKLTHKVGEKYVYSDLSFITLSYIVGKLARLYNYINIEQLDHRCVKDLGTQNDFLTDFNDDGISHNVLPIDICYFKSYIENYITYPLQMNKTMYIPPHNLWDQCAPTENDTFINRQIQGYVSDGNAFIAGGIAGHAGFFSNAGDLSILMRSIMKYEIFNETTVNFFTRVYNSSFSLRSLGWGTNLNHVTSCGSLSEKSYEHTGYTGTFLCNDPERQLIVILLTNRVCPTDKTGGEKVAVVRKEVCTLIQKLHDQ